MTETYHCRDCPPGRAIDGRVYRVQRRRKTFGAEGAVAGKVVAVDVADGWDIYCAEHYDARKARGDA